MTSVIQKGAYELVIDTKGDKKEVHVSLSFGDFIISKVVIDVKDAFRIGSSEDLLANFVGFELITNFVCVFNKQLFFEENQILLRGEQGIRFVRYLVFLKKLKYDHTSNEIFDTVDNIIPFFSNLDGYIRRMAYNQNCWSTKNHSTFNAGFRDFVFYLLLCVRFRKQNPKKKKILPITKIPVDVLLYGIIPFICEFDVFVSQDSFLSQTKRIFNLKCSLKKNHSLFDRVINEEKNSIIEKSTHINNPVEKELLFHDKSLIDLVSETTKQLASGMRNVHQEWECLLRLYNIMIIHVLQSDLVIFDVFEKNNFYEVLLNYFNTTITEIKFQEKYEYRHIIVMITDIFRFVFELRIRRETTTTTKINDDDDLKTTTTTTTIKIRKLEQIFFDKSVKNIIDSFLSNKSNELELDSQFLDYELLWENTDKMKYYIMIILKLIRILRVLIINQRMKEDSTTTTKLLEYIHNILLILNQVQRRRHQLVKSNVLNTLQQTHDQLTNLVIESFSTKKRRMNKNKKEEEKEIKWISEIVRYFNIHIIQKKELSIRNKLPIKKNEVQKKKEEEEEEHEKKKSENNKNNNLCVSQILLNLFFSPEKEEEENKKIKNNDDDGVLLIIKRRRRRYILGNYFIKSIVRTQSYSWFHKYLLNFETSWCLLTQEKEILIMFNIIHSYLNEIINKVKEQQQQQQQNQDIIPIHHHHSINNNNNSYLFMSESLWTRRFLNICYNIIENNSFKFLKLHYFSGSNLFLQINEYFRTMNKSNFLLYNTTTTTTLDTFIIVIHFLEKGLLAAISKDEVSVQEILSLVQNRIFQVWLCSMESKKNRRNFGSVVIKIIVFIISKWEKEEESKQQKQQKKQKKHSEEEEDDEIIIEYLRNELEFVKKLIHIDREIEKKKILFKKSFEKGIIKKNNYPYQTQEKPKNQEVEEDEDDNNNQKTLFEVIKEAWCVLSRISKKKNNNIKEEEELEGELELELEEEEEDNFDISEQIGSLTLFIELFKKSNLIQPTKKTTSDYFFRSNNNNNNKKKKRYDIILQQKKKYYQDQKQLRGLFLACRKSLARISSDTLVRFISSDFSGDPLKELRKKKTFRLLNLIINYNNNININNNNKKQNINNNKLFFFNCGLEKWVVECILILTKNESKRGLVEETTTSTNEDDDESSKKHQHQQQQQQQSLKLIKHHYFLEEEDEDDDDNNNNYRNIIQVLESVITKYSDDEEIISEFFNNKSVFKLLFQSLKKTVLLLPPPHNNNTNNNIQQEIEIDSPLIPPTRLFRKKNKKNKKNKKSLNEEIRRMEIFSHKDLNIILDCLRCLLLINNNNNNNNNNKIKKFESDKELVFLISTDIIKNILISHKKDMINQQQQQQKQKKQQNHNKKRHFFSFEKLMFIREYLVF